jgi:hypothetical protein
MAKCQCGCGSEVGDRARFALGHHWKVKREANGLERKTCDHCGTEFTRASVPGRQSDKHFRVRRYCSQGCSAAAKARCSPDGHVWCAGCSLWKLPADFWKDRSTKTGYQSACKACRSKFRGGARTAEQQKRSNLKKYGITLEDYEALHNAQAGVCAICGRPETTRNPKCGMKSLAVDHCHTTGKVRGLLCHNCNRGIGHLQESPEVMAAAVKYLSSHSY